MKAIFNSRLQFFIFTLFLSLSTSAVIAQSDEKRESPAAEASGKIGDVTVTVNYSSPAVKGRTVWGELVPFGKVWRTGANEATVIRFDKPVTIEGKRVEAGEYALFTIPEEDTWTIIFNKEVKQWGAYKYDETKDVLRVEVDPEKSDEFNERMNFDVVEENGQVVLFWENQKVPMTIQPAKG